MYYEAISHRSITVESAQEAATRIHEGNVCSCDALIWTAHDRKMCAVADGGLNRPWMEVAVIDLNRKLQIESITFGWIDTLAEKIHHLELCETTEFVMREARLPLDGEGESKLANFTCGCCGEWFESTIEEQRVFDQDEGHGQCPSCIKRIGGRMKTMSGWKESGLGFDEYFVPICQVSDDVFDYFIGCVPPVYVRDDGFQVGECAHYRNGVAYHSTFVKEEDQLLYLGYFPRGQRS